MPNSEMKLIMENWRKYCYEADEGKRNLNEIFIPPELLPLLVPAAAAPGPGSAAVATAGVITYQAVLGMTDMWKQYQIMKDPECRKDPEAKCGWKYSDKYFHCVAHCLASKRGWGGKKISQIFGAGRETADVIKSTLKGKTDSFEAVMADLIANQFGRRAAESGACGACWKYIPNGLPESLWIVPGVQITDAHREAVSQNIKCNPAFMSLVAEPLSDDCSVSQVSE